MFAIQLPSDLFGKLTALKRTETAVFKYGSVKQVQTYISLETHIKHNINPRVERPLTL